jgi:hypothetical protein
MGNASKRPEVCFCERAYGGGWPFLIGGWKGKISPAQHVAGILLAFLSLPVSPRALFSGGRHLANPGSAHGKGIAGKALKCTGASGPSGANPLDLI